MKKLPITAVIIILIFASPACFSDETIITKTENTRQFEFYETEIENTADNPRLVNITEQQKKALCTIEKRIYGNSFPDQNTIDRLERLETDLFKAIQKGTPTQRIETLKLESTRIELRGTAMTPMMMSTFNTKYINPRGEMSSYSDDVGIIDGLIRVWWPDFYAKISEYRRYKEATFY